jgi:hypothetical protein
MWLKVHSKEDTELEGSPAECGRETSFSFSFFHMNYISRINAFFFCILHTESVQILMMCRNTFLYIHTKWYCGNTCCEYFLEVFYPLTLVCLSLIYFSLCSSRLLIRSCFVRMVALCLNSLLSATGNLGTGMGCLSIPLMATKVDGSGAVYLFNVDVESSGYVWAWRHWNICMEDRESWMKFGLEEKNPSWFKSRAGVWNRGSAVPSFPVDLSYFVRCYYL